MKFFCLAYGAERDWKALPKLEQDALLAQDEVIRKRGALMAAVDSDYTTVRAWDGMPTITKGPFSEPETPLAGFSIIEADSLEDVIQMVAKSPCARANGAIEIRRIASMNDAEYKGNG